MSTTHYEKKANKDYNAALSTLSKKFTLGNKYKSAMPKFLSAAEIYKQLRLNYHAGVAFEKAASCMHQLAKKDSTYAEQAAKAYSEAAECFMNFQDEEGALERYLGDLQEYSKGLKDAASCYRHASDLFAEQGNLLRAAKMETQAAEAFEQVMLAMLRTRERLKERLESQIEEQKEEMIPDTDDNGLGGITSMDEDEVSQESKNVESASPDDEMMARVKKENAASSVSPEDIQQLNVKVRDCCEQAVDHYKRAADYYESNSNYPNANSALKHAADMAMDGEQYKTGQKILEKIFDADWNQEKKGGRSMIHFDSNTLLFKAVMCKLLLMDVSSFETDLELIKAYIEMYEPRTNNFDRSREGELILTICSAFEKRDLKRFLSGVSLFEKVGKLDDDTTKHLLRVRRKLEECINRLEDPILR